MVSYQKNNIQIMENNLLELSKDGKKISSVLPPHVKNFLIDIDGTICEDIPNEEPERMADAFIYPGALEKINQWYDDGHIITFFYITYRITPRSDHFLVKQTRIQISRTVDEQTERWQLSLDRQPRCVGNQIYRPVYRIC